MKIILSVVFWVALFATAVAAQQGKGIDTQTRKINDDANRTTTRTNDAARSIDFGKGKTKTRDRLSNPYRLNARRDKLVETILAVLKDEKIQIDESASRLSDGVVRTQPFVFSRGAVVTTNELNRYANLLTPDASWSGGRYALVIEVQSVDGIQNNVVVTAKVEGKAKNGLLTEWTTLPSSGQAEDEFLSKLVERVTGKSVDEPQD